MIEGSDQARMVREGFPEKVWGEVRERQAGARRRWQQCRERRDPSRSWAHASELSESERMQMGCGSKTSWKDIAEKQTLQGPVGHIKASILPQEKWETTDGF